MNRIYRLVFNRALRVWQVASEQVRRPAGSALSGVDVGPTRMTRLCWALCCVLAGVGVSATVQAQAIGRIVGDPNAPGAQRPTVLNAANGVPLVNITTPSAAGVSRNNYSQFDVGGQGAILNNSPVQSQTQLGGWVQGNPWLSTGAKVILNEVNGPVSHLGGYVEVAGARAEVVIANSAGIQVDGGGFLNASRVTLTTGTPLVSNGALDGYRVSGGTIQIMGAGLDSRSADYTGLLARAVQVNAGIWANQVQAVLGSNVVSADQQQITAQMASGAAPAFALDVGALGGMFANKIWLIGNEHGVGVRNAGNLGAQAGELVVTVDGRLENSGALQSQQDTQIAASGGIANAGVVSARGTLQVGTAADVDNSGGTLNAQRLQIVAATLRNQGGKIEQTGLQALVVNAGSLSNRAQGSLGMVAGSDGQGNTPATGTGTGAGTGTGTGTDGAGNTSGSGTTPNSDTGQTTTGAPLAPGLLTVTGALDNDGGRIDGAGPIAVSVAAGLDNSAGRLGVAALSVRGDLRNQAGTLAVYGDADLQLGALVNDQGHLDVTNALGLNAASLSNQGGSLRHGGSDATAWHVQGLLDNTGGVLSSNAAAWQLDAQTVVNVNGRIAHSGTQGLSLTAQDWSGVGGQIATPGALVWRAGSIDHRAATASASVLDVQADSLDNRGGSLLSTGTQAASVQVRDLLDNGAGGSIASNGDLGLGAGSFGNVNGQVQQAGGGMLRIAVGSLAGSGGHLLSNGGLTVSGGAIDLSGGNTSAQWIGIHADSLSTAGGQLTALGTQTLALQVQGALNNHGGRLLGNAGIDLQAGTLDNGGGTLLAAGHDGAQLTIGGTLDNTVGTLSANGDLTVQAGSVLNRGGSVVAAGGAALQIGAASVLDNSQGGRLAASGEVSVRAAALDNTQGAIEHAGDGTLSVAAQTLQGAGGKLLTQGSLQLSGGDLELGAGSTTQAKQITLVADTLNTAGGHVMATGDQTMTLRLSGALDNDGGSIAGNGALAVQAGALSNRGGTLTAAGSAESDIVVSGQLDNTQGTVASNGSLLSIVADQLINAHGTLSHTGSQGLTLTANGVTNTQGSIVSSAALTLAANTVDQRQGMLGAASLQLQAGTLDNSGGGRIVASGSAASLLHAQNLDNAGGTVASNGDLTLQAATLENTQGAIQHAGTGHLQIAADTLSGSGGSIVSNGTLGISGQNTDLSHGTTTAQTIGISTGTLDNSGGGRIVASGSAASVLHAQNLNNAGGTVASNGDLTLQAATLENTQGAIQHAGTGHLQIAADTLSGSGGSIVSNGTLGISGQSTDLSHGTTTAQTIGISTGTLDNSGGGRIVASGSAASVLHAQNLNNAGGTVASNGDLTLQAATLENTQGAIQHAGTGHLQIAADTLSGSGGSIVSNGTLGISGQSTDLSHGTTTAQTIGISTGTLDNSGGGRIVASGNAASVLHAQNLNNAGGTVASNGDLTLQAATLENTQGAIQHAGTGHLQIAADTLSGSGGSIVSNGTLGISGQSTDLSHGTTTAQTIGITTGTLDNSGGGRIVASGSAASVLHAQNLNNAGGTVASNGDLTLQAATLENTQGAIQHAGTGQLQIAADTLSGSGGSIVSNGTLGISGQSTDLSHGTTTAQTIGIATGTLDNSGGGRIVASGSAASLLHAQNLNNAGGTVASNGDLTLQAATLENTQGAIQHAGTGQLQIAADTLSGSGGSIVSNGTLGISGQNTDLSHGTTTAQTIGITTDTLDNSGGGRIVASGSAASVLHAQNLNNAGGTVASNGDLTLQAATLENTQGAIQHAGTGQLQIAADTLSGSGGSIVSNGTLGITGQSTDLSHGTTSAQTIGITTGMLSTAGGHLTASGTQALNLAIGGTLDNTGGAIGGNGVLALNAQRLLNAQGSMQAAGQGLSTLRIAQDVQNQQGKLLLGGAGQIDAASLANQGGIVSAAGSRLQVQVGGALDNHAHGILSSGGQLLLTAGTLDNSSTGTVVAGSDLSAQIGGTLENDAGILQASGAVQLQSAGLSNRAGSVVGGTLSVDTQGQALDNSGGTLGSQSGALAVHSGPLFNVGGRVQAKTDLSVQTDGQVIVNTGSGANGGLLAGGGLQVDGDRLDNRGGVVFAQGDARLGLNSVDNSVAGSLSAAGNLSLNAATLNNAGGRVQGGQTLALTLSGDLNNQAGLLAANGLLSLTAATLDNRNTFTADNALGVQAGQLQLQAQALNNQQGQLLSNGASSVQLSAGLDNSGGRIASGGSLNTHADALTNTAGVLRSQGNQFLAARALSGDGQVQSQGDLSLSLHESLTNTGQLIANGHLSVHSDGDLVNQGVLRAGNLDLSAANVDNAASGEISSQGATHVQAGGQLTNRGLIDGALTQLQAASVDNVGTGRVYGDHIAIAAGTLLNRAESVAGVTHAATVAARQRLDLGVGQLSNTDGALIYSDGDAAIGGALDGNQQAIGNAARVDNLGSTIEIAGTLALHASALNNIRQNVVVTQTTTTAAPVRLDQPSWRNNGQNAHNDLRSTSNYSAYEVYYLNPQDILQDTAYTTPDGYQVHQATIRLTAQTSAYFFARGAMYSATGERSRLDARTGTVTIYYVDRDDHNVNPDQVSSGASDPFAGMTADEPGAPPFHYESDTLKYSNAYGTCTSNCVRLIAQYAYTDPDHILSNPQGTGGGGLEDNEQYRIATRTTVQDVLQPGSGPEAVIHAGGAMHIVTDNLHNTYARIAAGGDLSIDGISGAASVTNLAQTLYRTDSFDNMSHAYNGTTRQWSNPSISVQIGQVGGSITSGGTLHIDVGDLSNLNQGRSAPNVQDGSVLANLDVQGAQGAVGGGVDPLHGPGGVSGSSAAQAHSTATQRANATTAQADAAGAQANAQVSTQISTASAQANAQVGTQINTASVQANAQVGTQINTTSVQANAQVGTVSAQAGTGSAIGAASGQGAVSGSVAVNAAGGSPDRIVMGAPNTQLPSASLFNVQPNGGHALVETDPRFTNYRVWLSSDAQLRQLGYNADTTQQRLGDGYYEQKLVREQIGQLTGRRFLEGYGSDEAQYQALLDAGATVGKAWGLRPGVALTAAQMAQLTSDIVWLVAQTVTLPDGRTTTALVPQVYLRLHPGDLDSGGALLAGANVDAHASGTLTNTGSIAGRQLVSLEAGRIEHLGGSISGNQVALTSASDIDIRGASVSAVDALSVRAAGNIAVASTVETLQGGGGHQYATTQMARVAGLYVTGATGSGVLSVVGGGDVSLQGAQVRNAGTDGVTQLVAGHDLSLGAQTLAHSTDTTDNARNYQRSSQTTHAVSSVQGAGDVVLAAGHDVILQAAQIGAGKTLAVQAGHDLDSQAVTDSSTHSNSSVSKHNTLIASTHDEHVQGTQLGAGGDIVLRAGNDLTLASTAVGSQNGAIALAAGHDVALTATQEQHDAVVDQQTRKHTLVSSKTTTTHDESHDSQAVTSSLSGDTVHIAAGHDLLAQGAQIVGTGDVVLAAGNNLTLETAQNTHSEEHDSQRKKSGLFSGGGASVTFGKQSIKTDATSNTLTHTGSTVGSLQGDVTLVAGNTLAISGSDVMALQGDLTAKAKAIAITEVHDTTDSTQQTAFKQGGLTMSVTSAALNLAQSAVHSAQAGSQAQGDARMQALAGASAAYSAYGASQAMDKLLSATSAKDAAQGAGLNVAITVGGSHSHSESEQHSDTAKGSTLHAGGNVTLIATGGGDDSNVFIRGSDVKAGNNLLLAADHDITVESAQDSSEQHSRSKSGSAAIGAAISYGANGPAMGFTASASSAHGQGDGTDVTQRNSHLSAGNTATLISGHDTTLDGAVLSAHTVMADVGGDLHIHSEQDSSHYASHDTAAGGSITAGIGASGSASYSHAKVDGDFASVREQSGIQAGDGGFDVTVHGNTDLKGGVIASTQAAIDQGRNQLSTGTLTVADITNSSHYSANGVNLSGGYAAGGSNGKPDGKSDGSSGDSTSNQMPSTANQGSSWSWQNQGSGAKGTAAGYDSKRGSQTSITHSGISGGDLTITDAAGQQAKSGQSVADTLAALKRDVHTGDSGNGLVKDWNGQQLQQQVSNGAQIMATFGQQAGKAIGDYASQKALELRGQGNEAEAAKWDEGGVYRVAAHAAMGALGGGVQGALGAGAAASAAPRLNDLTKDLPDGVREAVGAGLAAGLGAVTGGASGAATAFNADTNNRQLHQDSNQNEVARLKEMANGDPQREADLVAAACALVKCSAEYPDGSDEKKYWAAIEAEGNKPERQEDRDWLKSQSQTTNGYAAGSAWEENRPLFTYGGVDAIGDWATKNQVGTRALGGLQMLGGAAESAGGLMLAPTCETGIGCLASVYLTGTGADNTAAGSTTLFSGKATSTLGGQALQALGLQPGTAELLYGFTQMAPSAGAALAANRAVNLEMAANAWARSTYTGSGAVDYQGLIYRYTDPEYAEGTWRLYSGNVLANHRYSPKGIGAVYAGTKASTSVAEVASYDALDGKVLVSRDVNVGGVLDLTNPAVRKALWVDMQDLTEASHGGNSYVSPQRISAWAREQGYDAILAPSAQEKGGNNLILFKNVEDFH